MSALHSDDKRPMERTIKRSRLLRGLAFPTAVADMERGQSGTTPTGAHDNDSNGASGSDEGAMHIARSGSGGFRVDAVMRNTNSSSPSHGEYQVGGVNGRDRDLESYERNNGGLGGARLSRNTEESQNDWEVVVDMYQTGRGTDDGVALKMITKGDGRKVPDRKLLEKRRTIGKTYELLGAERFEAAIGYKWENGVRRKQKMYHVISRCRVVNAMRRAGEAIPENHEKLTSLIDDRIADKEAQKEAGRSSAVAASGNEGILGTSGNRVRETGVGSYRVDAMGRMVGVGPSGRTIVRDAEERDSDVGARGLGRLGGLPGVGKGRGVDEISAVVRQDRGRFG